MSPVPPPPPPPLHPLAACLVLAGLALSGLVAAQSSGGRFAVAHEVIAAGGARQTAGTVALTGTVAQPAAAQHAGGRFRLGGGFHQPRHVALDGPLLRDGFESP